MSHWTVAVADHCWSVADQSTTRLMATASETLCQLLHHLTCKSELIVVIHESGLVVGCQLSRKILGSQDNCVLFYIKSMSRLVAHVHDD